MSSDTMGWRDRDYAQWTDEERRRFYGSNSSYAAADDWPRSAPPSSQPGLLRPDAGLAIVASLCIALGQLPLHHPIVPAFHFNLPGSRAPAAVPTVGAIRGLSTAGLGSTLTLNGAAPQGNGAVTVEGSYDNGQTWQTLSTVTSANGSYSAQIALNQRGLLQLKVVFSDGSSEVGSVTVQ